MEKIVPKKAVIAQPSLYRSWDAYITRFCKVGGVIEATPLCPKTQISMPSVSFFIEPNGETKLIGTFDRIEATQYVNGGCFFPSTSLHNQNLTEICHQISAKLYDKGLIGHVTVDLVAFPDPQEPGGAPLFWAVDINANLSDYAAVVMFFDILMEGKLDPETGEYEIESIDEMAGDLPTAKARNRDQDTSPEKVAQLVAV